MSAYRFVTLTCDSCGEVYDDGIITKVAEARRQASFAGWTQPSRGQDRCGVCNGTHVRNGWSAYDAPAAP